MAGQVIVKNGQLLVRDSSLSQDSNYVWCGYRERKPGNTGVIYAPFIPLQFSASTTKQQRILLMALYQYIDHLTDKSSEYHRFVDSVIKIVRDAPDIHQFGRAKVAMLLSLEGTYKQEYADMMVKDFVQLGYATLSITAPVCYNNCAVKWLFSLNDKSLA